MVCAESVVWGVIECDVIGVGASEYGRWEFVFFFQAEDGVRDAQESRGLGDVYKRQVRSRPALLLRRPAWLPEDGSRGRNVPESMTWKPFITWAQALVDTLFATNVKPGDFQSLGHDYRADLGAVVTAAYDLDADAATAERLESYLRAKELERARTIGEA